MIWETCVAFVEAHDGRRLVAAVRVGVDAVDVDLHLRRHGEELCEHAALVVADDLDLDRVVPCRGRYR